MPHPTQGSRRTSWTPTPEDDAAVAIIADFLRKHEGWTFPSYTEALRYGLRVAVDVLKPVPDLEEPLDD